MLDGNLLAGLGALLATLSGVAFYLASPHQKLLAAPWPGRWGWAPGAGLLLASLPLLCAGLDLLAAIFAWATLLMTALTIAPFGALLRARAGGRRP